MCGRYVQSLTPADLEDLVEADVRAENIPEPSWNIAPTQQVPVVLEGRRNPGERRLESARWALTPTWSKTLETRTPLFNARIETVLEKPSFKAAAKHRRCALPATGYYEWSGPQERRVPHFIHSDAPILFAGLASWWRDGSVPEDAPDGAGWRLTTTILTMDSYGPMRDIHDRIPVFLAPELLADWLSPAIEGNDELMAVVAGTAPSVGDGLREHAVAPLRGDGPQLIAEIMES